MQILKGQTNFDFLARRPLAHKVSGVLLIISILALLIRGLNFGIDFTGGTLVELGYQKEANLNEIRQTLTDSGFSGAVVQNFGTTTDVLVRLAPREENKAELSAEVLKALGAGPSDTETVVEVRRIDFVGPQVGGELTEQGGLAMLIALGAIFVYVLFRFEWRFSAGSVVALFHDVLLVVGFFALLGLEFDLTVLAAILAVIGYSLNDTIVVFDRIRENFRRIRKGTTEEIVNRSLNETLSRTLMTSLTTLLVLIALFVFGGKLIHGFSTALIIGVIVGTYSSIYVASSTVISLGVSKSDLMPVVKEGVELDDRP